MSKLRRRHAEGRVQGKMLGHRGEPLLAAEHVRYAHLGIVHSVCQVVRRPAVALEQDRIVAHTRELVRAELEVAIHKVLVLDRPHALHAQTHHVRTTLSDELLSFVFARR